LLKLDRCSFLPKKLVLLFTIVPGILLLHLRDSFGELQTLKSKRAKSQPLFFFFFFFFLEGSIRRFPSRSKTRKRRFSTIIHPASAYSTRHKASVRALGLFLVVSFFKKKKKKKKGLVQGISGFTTQFCPDETCQSLTTKKHKLSFFSPEPDFFLVIMVEVPRAKVDGNAEKMVWFERELEPQLLQVCGVVDLLFSCVF
jgi:hypothetical protein